MSGPWLGPPLTAKRYVITSRFVDDVIFHIIERMDENQRLRTCFVEFARAAAPGVKSAVSSCVFSWF